MIIKTETAMLILLCLALAGIIGAAYILRAPEQPEQTEIYPIATDEARLAPVAGVKTSPCAFYELYVLVPPNVEFNASEVNFVVQTTNGLACILYPKVVQK